MNTVFTNSSMRLAHRTMTAAVAITALAFAMSNDAAAQSPYHMIDTIRTMALERGPYRVEIEQRCVVVIDRSTRERLVNARLELDGRIEMVGRVGSLERRDPEAIDEMASSIDAFNLGFRLARLELDPTSGDVTISRTFDAESATASEVALEIVRFGDLVHQERIKFLEAQKSAAPYCAVTCRPAARKVENSTR